MANLAILLLSFPAIRMEKQIKYCDKLDMTSLFTYYISLVIKWLNILHWSQKQEAEIDG